MTYSAPVRDIRFSLEVAGLSQVTATGAFEDLPDDLLDGILSEAGRLASDVLAPLNAPGDREGSSRHLDGSVQVPAGFADAYAAFVAGGWQAVPFDPAFGGMGLPQAVALGVHEMVHGANMSFGLCPMLTLGAVEALSAHGSPDLQRLYLPRLVTGEWSGTMNLTEPQAGSDVGALTARALPQPDGTYRLFGQKIYITWGEHPMAANIVHLVLARLPDAPAGNRGISLFLVPKFVPDAAGQPGARNDVTCLGLEHKMGIHASPTCTMGFGEGIHMEAGGGAPGAIGWLVGEPNRGLAAMFTMMNSARLNVGLQGVAVADAAFQKAHAYAQERRQGRAEGWTEAGPSPIFHHADVRRMLMTMKARVAAARTLCHMTAIAADLATAAPDAAGRQAARARGELLTPIAKGWSTDMGVDVASLGVQIHGGMGFVEEGGAAQFYRDARIAAIYEGTNGIQAIDLVTRKLPMDDGAVFGALVADMRRDAARCRAASSEQLRWIGERLEAAIDVAEEAGAWLVRAQGGNQKRDALAGATPFLKLAGDVTGGWALARGALLAHERMPAPGADVAWLTARVSLAGFYAENILSQVPGQLAAVTAGADTLFEPLIEALAG